MHRQHPRAYHAGTAAVFARRDVERVRALQPDMLNGYWANWGHDDRTVKPFRVPRRRAARHCAWSSGPVGPEPRTRTSRPRRCHAARDGVERGTRFFPAAAAGRRAEPGATIRIPARPAPGARRDQRPTRSCATSSASRLVTAFAALEADGVGALRGGRRRPRHDRRHGLGAGLLPAVLLSRADQTLRRGRWATAMRCATQSQQRRLPASTRFAINSSRAAHAIAIGHHGVSSSASTVPGPSDGEHAAKDRPGVGDPIALRELAAGCTEERGREPPGDVEV